MSSLSTPSRSLSFSGLRAVHNARTRIFAAGRDPLFGAATMRSGRTAASRERLRRSLTSPSAGAPLWRANLLDRLESPLTRYRE